MAMDLDGEETGVGLFPESSGLWEKVMTSAEDSNTLFCPFPTLL